MNATVVFYFASYPSITVFYLQKTIADNWYFSIALHREITNDIRRRENGDSMNDPLVC